MNLRSSVGPLFVDIHTLLTRSVLQIESSAELARAISSRSPSAVSPIRELRPPARERTLDLAVAPIELLLALGKATAVPSVAVTSLRVSSLWAVLRYLWAFEPSPPRAPMTLSHPTEHVVRHQRSVMSEQFGIALAAWLYETQIARGPAEIIDAEWAMTSPSWQNVLRLSQRQPRRWPDYFMFPRASRWPLAVVECKGNSGANGRSETEAQLADAIAQVVEPTLRGFNPRRIAFAAVTPRGARRIRVFGVESRRRGRPGRAVDSNKVAKRGFSGPDPSTPSWARLLAYAGAYEAALNVLLYGEGPVDNALGRVRVLDQEAIGTSVQMDSGAGVFRLFTGVLTPMFEAYRLGDRRMLASARTIGPANVDGEDKGIVYAAFSEPDFAEGDRATAVSSDGAVLSISSAHRQSQ